MNRHERRKAARGKRREVHLPPGRLMLPMVGTTYFDENGTPVGVWGTDLPLKYQIDVGNGYVRDLTKAECALAHHIYGDPNERFSQ